LSIDPTVLLGGGAADVVKAGAVVGESTTESIVVTGEFKAFEFAVGGYGVPGVMFSLNKKTKFLLTHFLMVIFFSLSNKRKSHFEARIPSRSSQRLLTTGIKSAHGFFLPTGQFLM